MKSVAVTQRVDVIESYGEARDALDQRWIDFLLSINLYPILIPNNRDYVQQLLKSERLEGVLLTGGNSLAQYGGIAPERDEVENLLLDWAIENSIPVLGVCRGMQVIQHYFDNELIQVPNHVAKYHVLKTEEGCRLNSSVAQYEKVNSYHDLGAYQVQGKDLKLVASSLDGVVMAIEHVNKEVYGIMWHSEREQPFLQQEQLLYKHIFNKAL